MADDMADDMSDETNDEMNSPAPFGLGGQVWMTVGGQHLGGHDRVGLLAAIAAHGSISAAARAVGISYKGAWDAIDAMNNLAGEALVARLTGGKGGGGTRLTARGQQLVDNFRTIERAHQLFVEQLSRQSGSLADDLLLIRHLTMKTSARNQFLGTVTAIERGAVNDAVTLAIAGGLTIVATITQDSTASLGLQVGSTAYALVKASSVIVATQEEGSGAGMRLSARNQLAGTVSRLLPGAVHADVSIALPGGGTVGATVTTDSCAALGLAVGMPATALFKASSVILGVPA